MRLCGILCSTKQHESRHSAPTPMIRFYGVIFVYFSLFLRINCIICLFVFTWHSIESIFPFDYIGIYSIGQRQNWQIVEFQWKTPNEKKRNIQKHKRFFFIASSSQYECCRRLYVNWLASILEIVAGDDEGENWINTQTETKINRCQLDGCLDRWNGVTQSEIDVLHLF